MSFDEGKWDTVIEAKKHPFSFDLNQISEYRDLIFLFVKRDIATTYKQTILGPLWYIFQPVFSTVMFMIVFRHVASLGTDGVPPVLFYSIGTIIWYFFSSLLTAQAKVLYSNKDIFGKVYFPRLTVPISVIISELIKFLIQFLLFAFVFIFYIFNGYSVFFSVKLLLLPVMVLWVILMATGIGLTVSSVTTKYRDLAKALEYFLSLIMYVSPVVYPLSEVPEGFRIFFVLNPVTGLLECMRYACFGAGEISLFMILYSVFFTLIILFAGILLFNKNEKEFVDVI